MKLNTSIWERVVFLVLLATCLHPLINAPTALILGLGFAFFLKHPFQSSNKKAFNFLLKAAIIGLGFGMNLGQVLNAGQQGFTITLFTIVIVLFFGFLLGKVLNQDSKLTHLISSGTAICGGSAIAAVSPIINASEKDISISLGVIFILNSIALLAYPPIGFALEMSQQQFGIWSAIAIHDTSSVVGAAHVFGQDALNTATTVKMVRVLWIIPISLLSVLLFRGKTTSIKMPWFIALFILAILINNYSAIPTEASDLITKVAKKMLVVSLFLIGSSLSIQRIKEAGWKPMVLGFSLWFFISIASLLAVLQLY